MEKNSVEEKKLSDFYLDLTTVDSEMDSNWWNQIYGNNFGFKKSIQLMRHCHVWNDDILIHKKLLEGEKFPQIRYFFIMDNQPYLLSNDDIKSNMINTLLSILLKQTPDKRILPYACTVEEFFKNGNVKIVYKPSDWDSFALFVSVKRGKKFGITNLHEFFTGLETIVKNPAETTQKISKRII